MMRFKRKKLEVAPPYVSMADIAFNLVLFFVILARTQDDSHLKWEPAKSAATRQIENASMSITVDVDGKTYLNGQQVGIIELPEGIASQLAAKGETKGKVLLKIHKETQALTFEPIIKAVSKAGCEVVHVLEEQQ